jgi:hypothetical protein
MSVNLESQGSVLTGGRQTMASWSKVIESYETLPDIYKSFFEVQTADDQRLPYTLLTPCLVKPQGKTTEKLIYDTADAIHILEWKGSQVIAKSYPYQAVCTVEVGIILLNSWLTISGVTSTGEASVTTIDFNTSSARHFTPFLNKLRPESQGADEIKLRVEKDKFNYLSTLNFKLMNYGRSSLLHGETILQIIFQPEIREPIWKMLGSMFQRIISMAHLVILTSHELILIQDVRHNKNAQGPQYGGVWQYIPLRSIKSAVLSETENERLTLSITVSPDKTIEKLFAVSSQPELEQLCAQLQEMIA